MNNLMIAISFFAVIFAGSLFYRVKTKNSTMFSFLLNMEFEYIFMGMFVYYLALSTDMPGFVLVKPIIYLILTFMGMIIGSHFSYSLLINVPVRIMSVTIIIYLACLPAFYFAFKSCGCRYPFVYAVILNTLMPYSVNLGAKLFKLPRDRIFVSSLIASLFPFVSLVAYAMAAGFFDYRPKDFGFTLGISIFFSLLFAKYGNVKSKKVVQKVSIMFVLVIAGIAQYHNISPLVIGFMVGFFLADTGYGNIFHEMSINFERFLYIFFYVAFGVLLGIYVKVFDLNLLTTSGFIIFAVVFIRLVFAKWLINIMLPAKNEFVSLASMGVLPVVLILDFGSRQGFKDVSMLTILFLIVHLVTEMVTYLVLKNEKNGS